MHTFDQFKFLVVKYYVTKYLTFWPQTSSFLIPLNFIIFSENIKVLNLSGALLDVYDAMQHLGLGNMKKLIDLDISGNPIPNWNTRIFSSNKKLMNLKMSHIDNDITLTKAMIEDFNQSLTLLGTDEK